MNNDSIFLRMLQEVQLKSFVCGPPRIHSLEEFQVFFSWAQNATSRMIKMFLSLGGCEDQQSPGGG